MTKQIQRNLILSIVVLALTAGIVLVPLEKASAEETGNISITQKLNTNYPFLKDTAASFEIRLIGPDKNYLTESFPSTGTAAQSVKSGDVLEITNNTTAVVNSIPAGTKYEVRRFEYKPRIKVGERLYTGTIEAGKTADITNNESVLSSGLNQTIEIKTNISGGPAPAEKTVSYKLIPQGNIPTGLTGLPDGPVTAAGSGVMVFDPLQITQGFDSFTVDIVPVIPEENDGYVYDQTKWSAVITTVWGEAKSSKVSYLKNGEPVEGIPEFNISYLEPVSFSPKIEKKVLGDSPSDETFTFKLTASPNNPDGATLPQKTTAEIKNGETGTFDPITFTKPNTYEFEISEQADNIFGFSFDKDKYDLTVQVNQTEKGLSLTDNLTLNGEPVEGGSALFQNEYNSGSLQITKKVTGTSGNGKFKLKVDLKDSDNQPLSQSYPYSGASSGNLTSGESISLGDGESITITKLPAGALYSVSEEEIPAGFTPEYENENGTIEKGQTASVVCTNTYQPASVTFTPKAVKNITGDEPQEAEDFAFTLSESGDNPDGAKLPENIQATVSGEGEAEFNPITFTKAGTYTYKITENKQDLPGYSFDEGEWTLTVEVEDQNAQLAVSSASYSKGEEKGDAAEFTNTYKLSPAEAIIKVKKEITGEAPEEYKDFSFILSDKNSGESGYTMPENTKLTLDLTKSSSGAFGPVTFTAPGEYQFGISEEAGSLPGLTYDSQEKVCTVRVTRQGNTLNAQIAYESSEGSDEAVFTNSYQGADLSLTKKVEGTQTEQSFSFRITLRSEDEEELTGSFKLTDSDGEELGTIRSGGTVTLKQDETKIIKNLPSGASYTLNEVDIPSGYTPDEDEISGTIELAESNSAEFTNHYNPEPVSVSAAVKKTLKGESPETPSDFHFVLESDSKNPDGDPLDEPLKTTLNGQGEGTFDALTFTKAGDYTYRISEEDDKLPGYSYDSAGCSFAVSVTDNNGILSAKTTYQKEGSKDPAEKAEFINTYHPEAVEYSPKVKKTVNGETPVDGLFSFRILPEENQDQGFEMPENTALEITGSGEGTFEPITFTEAGTYTFLISENDQGSPGYVYDKTVWTVSVEIADFNGNLQVKSAEYSRKSDESSQDNEAEPNINKTQEEDKKQPDNGSPGGAPSSEENEQKLEKVSLTLPVVKASNNVQTENLTLKELEEKENTDSELPEDDQSNEDTFSSFFENSTQKIKDFFERNSQAVFENLYQSGDLQVVKRVDGPDDGSDFSFKLSLFNPDGTSMEESLPVESTRIETIKTQDHFNLKKDEEILIKNIPAGTHYLIEEEAAPGYTSESNGSEGMIIDGVISEAEFINTKTGVLAEDPPDNSSVTPTGSQNEIKQNADLNPNTYSAGKISTPDTGDSNRKTFLLFLILVSLCVAGFFFYRADHRTEGDSQAALLKRFKKR